MGGAATAVSDATRNVYVEAAFWWPEAVAGRSRRYNFTTDAGHRFERGVDPATTVEHIERITPLIVEICGGAETRCGPIDDHVVALPNLAPVVLRVARAAKVIGMPVTQADCEGVMTRLGFAWTGTPGRIGGGSAELALRPQDRGRPDRGGDPPHRLRRARRAPVARHARRPRDQRGAAHAGAAAPRAGRPRLAGDDQLQLRRRALGARLRRQRRIPCASSTRSPRRTR